MIRVSTRRGPFTQVEVYHPKLDQLWRIIDRIRPTDVILIRSSPSRLAFADSAIVAEEQIQTTTLDLSLSEQELLRGMDAKSCRYMIRRAEKLGERIAVQSNDSQAHRDFLSMYNRFVAQKDFGACPLTPARMAKFEGFCDVFVVYIDRNPLAAQLNLRDPEERRVNHLMAVSVRFDAGVDRTMVGLANRYLYWHVLRFYKSSGFALYDFGGIDSEKVPEITSFKLSFGGDVVTLYSYIIAGTLARSAIRLREGARRLLRRAGIDSRVYQI